MPTSGTAMRCVTQTKLLCPERMKKARATLVARDGDAIVGHVKLLEMKHAGAFELKSMAVSPVRQG